MTDLIQALDQGLYSRALAMLRFLSALGEYGGLLDAGWVLSALATITAGARDAASADDASRADALLLLVLHAVLWAGRKLHSSSAEGFAELLALLAEIA